MSWVVYEYMLTDRDEIYGNIRKSSCTSRNHNWVKSARNINDILKEQFYKNCSFCILKIKCSYTFINTLLHKRLISNTLLEFSPNLYKNYLYPYLSESSLKQKEYFLY